MDYLTDIRSNYGALIHSAYNEPSFREDALDRLRLLIYDGMFAFTILMSLFFFLFVYYFFFGTLVGAISGDEIDGEKYVEEQKDKVRRTEDEARKLLGKAEDQVRRTEEEARKIMGMAGEKVKAWW